MLLVLALVSSLGNSEPRSTANPPDSVVHDSIYSLAVKPADYPKNSFVWLLDEGVYTVEPDGRGRTTIRQVVQMLKATGAQQYREQRLSYDPTHQRLTVNWMRVVKPTGEMISAAPTQIQESDVAASMGTPVYTSTKVRRMSLTGLDSGTVLDYSYSIDETDPVMPGNFIYGWRVTTGVPVMRSLLVLDVPRDFHPRIVENHLTFARTEQTSGGRTMYKWALDKVMPPKVEMFAPDTSIKVMTVSISPPFGWDAIGKWYAPIAESHYAINPAISEKIHQVVAGAKNLDDSVKSIHKWVASDIRYVAIELGRGGYVPRNAATVAQSGFGDCKDKTMLFLAALRSIGVKGYPVVLNLMSKVDEKLPNVSAFNHMIAAVEDRNGLVFTDLTASDLPYGKLGPTEQGKFALLVRGGGGDTIHLPGDSAHNPAEDVRIVGTIAADGGFSGYMTQTARGMSSGMAAMLAAHPPDSAMKAVLARSLASSVFDGAEGDSLSVATEDSAKAFTIHLRIKGTRVTSEAGTLQLLTSPIKPPGAPARMAADLERADKRTLPIDLAKLSPGLASHYEADLTLPAGWHVILPKNTSVTGLAGNFAVTYEQVGNELRITRVMSGGKGIIGPERIGDVISALKVVSSATARTIAIKTQ